MKTKRASKWKPKSFIYHHNCHGNCSCNHVSPERMERILSYIFWKRAMPPMASPGERMLVLRGRLVMPYKNGKPDSIQLSPRGEDVLLDLMPD